MSGAGPRGRPHSQATHSEADGSTGVEVAEVRAGSPPRPPVSRGDVVVSVDGAEVSAPSELQAAIDDRTPGESLPLAILRDGEASRLTVRLGTRPA